MGKRIAVAGLATAAVLLSSKACDTLDEKISDKINDSMLEDIVSPNQDWDTSN